MIQWQMASPGNWMHLQYQSKLQARKALSKDGKVFGDAIMVGVKPCIDKVSAHFTHLRAICLSISSPFDQTSKSGDIEPSLKPELNSSEVVFKSLFQSVMDSSVAVSSPLSISFSSSVLPSTPRSAIRPLSAAYRSSDSDYQVIFDLRIQFVST